MQLDQVSVQTVCLLPVSKIEIETLAFLFASGEFCVLRVWTLPPSASPPRRQESDFHSQKSIKVSQSKEDPPIHRRTKMERYSVL